MFRTTVFGEVLQEALRRFFISVFLKKTLDNRKFS